jgi:hypothetical protein
MKKRPAKSKRIRDADNDDAPPEYDSSETRRNPYSNRRRESADVVMLDPDVAVYFPDSASVNRALRALSAIIRRHSKSRRST